MLLADLPLNEPSQWLASLVEFKVGVMVCNLSWATGDFWSVAHLGGPGDIYSWWAGEVCVFFFLLFLVFFFFFPAQYYYKTFILDGRIIAAGHPLGSPNGLVSLRV